MLESLLVYERDFFLWLNGCHTLFFDNFFWMYSGKVAWVPLALVILFCLVYKENRKESAFVLLFLILTILLCDQFASHICKPLFARFRPTHHPDFMNEVKTVFGYRGGRYGFISSHAANAFGFATYLSFLLRNKWLALSFFLWALINSYSRIYLGVHFISDIVPGAISGLFFGWICYHLYLKVHYRLLPQFPVISYGKKRINGIIIAFLLTHLMLILVSAYKTIF